MDQDLFALIGAIAGFVATIFSIIDKLEDWAQRARKRTLAAADPSAIQNEEDEDDEEADQDVPNPKPRVSRGRRRRWWTIHWPAWLGPAPAYLIPQELAIICGAGMLLNSVGLLVSIRLGSPLFLDMVGTAFAAFLLGPWWGAATALLTNGLVNWLLFPHHHPDLLIFPWALVNMAGAFYWGLLARTDWFRRYLRTGHTSLMSHVRFLLVCGALGAAVLSLPGAIIQSVVAQGTTVTLNPTIVEGLQQLLTETQRMAATQWGLVLGGASADGLGSWLLPWLHACLLYLPDKIVSVAIAMTILKRGFPIFEEELLAGRDAESRPTDNRLAPLFLGLLYMPVFAVLISSEAYLAEIYWPLWGAPWVLIIGGYFWLRRHGPAEEALRAARIDRAARYQEERRPFATHPATGFCQRLTVGWLMACAVVALFMPVMLEDASAVAFNFFALIYGSMLAIHLIRVSVMQNMTAQTRSADDSSTGMTRRRRSQAA